MTAAAVSVAAAVLVPLAGCARETSASGIQSQPGVYPLLLIGVVLVLGGIGATVAANRRRRGGNRASGPGRSRRRDGADARKRGGADRRTTRDADR